MINLLANIPADSLPRHINGLDESEEIKEYYLLHNQRLYELKHEAKAGCCEGCNGCDYRLINSHDLKECLICTYDLNATEVTDQRKKLIVLLEKNYYELYRQGVSDD